MADELRVLFPQKEIRERIRALAKQISRDYAGRVTEEEPLLLLCTLRGAVFFAADLARALTVPCEIDFIKVRSYVDMQSVYQPKFSLGKGIRVKKRNVLIVEDIVDTGRTMQAVTAHYMKKSPASVEICTLLDKREARDPECADVCPKYVGFAVDPVFVVGCGLDCNEKYRLLPDIMELHRTDGACRTADES